MTPMPLMALPFDIAPFRVIDCFLGAISAVEEVFEEDIMIFGREIFSVETYILMKAPVCGGDFPPQVTVNSHHKKEMK